MDKLKIVIVALGLWSCSARSSSSKVKDLNVDSIFKARFYSNYEPRECGDNILGLLDEMTSAGIDLTDFRVVRITNQGRGSLGMVNAQAARDVLFNKPAPIEKNWYHHVILVNTVSGIVYDFDYLTTPTPTPIAIYVKTMFLDEPECATVITNLSTFCVGVDEKLDYYKWELAPIVPEKSEPTVKTMRQVSSQELSAPL